MYHIVLVLVQFWWFSTRKFKLQRTCSRSERWTGLQRSVPQRRKGPDLKTSKTDDTTTIPTKKPWPRTSILASQVVKKVRSLNLEYWKVYTSDKWILETVVGYQIEFTHNTFSKQSP